MIKVATDVDVSEDAIKERVAYQRGILERRRARRGAAGKEFSEELELVRWKEICGILLCHSLQQDISEYLRREAEAQEKVEALIDDYGRPDVMSEEQLNEMLAAHPDNLAQLRWGRVAKKAIRVLAFQICRLLTYTRLRRLLHYDLAWACKHDSESNLPISGEYRAILSVFSSKAEYHVTRGSWPDVDGEVVKGPFVLLNEDFDVVARVRRHIAQAVSLRLHDDEGPDDEDDESE